MSRLTDLLRDGWEPGAPPSSVEPSQAFTGPRISRLTALAIRMRELADQGEGADHAELARPAPVSRAHITQIINLLLLAPDVQEAILFMPRTDGRRVPIRERHIRPIFAVFDWRKQRRMWDEMLGSRESETGNPTRRSTD